MLDGPVRPLVDFGSGLHDKSLQVTPSRCAAWVPAVRYAHSGAPELRS